MKYHKIPNLFENQSALVNGKEIGSGTIRYIQDSGQKVTGNTYIDRNTNELYLCVTTTNSVNNDGNFKKFNLKEAFNKLDNLGGEFQNTEWIDGTLTSIAKYNHNLTPEGLIVKYKILNGVCFLKLNLALHSNSPQAVIAKFSNWKYGDLVFTFGGFGDRGGTNEGKSLKINSDGSLIHNLKSYTGQYSWFLTGVSCCPII